MPLFDQPLTDIMHCRQGDRAGNSEFRRKIHLRRLQAGDFSKERGGEDYALQRMDAIFKISAKGAGA